MCSLGNDHSDLEPGPNPLRSISTPGWSPLWREQACDDASEEITDALAGKTPIMQKVWLKALRPLIAFAIDQGDCKTDPTMASMFRLCSPRVRLCLPDQGEQP